MNFEILPGLPPYGEPMVPIPPGIWAQSGQEGLVVRFRPDTGPSWVGNFECDSGLQEGVFLHPDGHRVIVVASGLLYEVDPSRPESVADAGFSVTDVWQLPDGDLLLSDTYVSLKRWGPNGERWDSGGISCDGFKDVHVENDRVVGKGYEIVTGDFQEFEFEVDLETGALLGRAEDTPWRQAEAPRTPGPGPWHRVLRLFTLRR